MLLTFLIAGCMTDSARRAYVRAKKYTTLKAAEGDILAGFITNELTLANKITGADKIADDVVPLTVEASKANIVVLEADYKSIMFWKQLGKGILGWATANLPWLAPVLGGFGVAMGLAKKLFTKTKALSAAIKIGGKLKAVISGEGKALDKFKEVHALAKAEGPSFVDGSKELYAEYVKAKASGKA